MHLLVRTVTKWEVCACRFWSF